MPSKKTQIATKTAIEKKMLFYDNFAEDFDSVVNRYDTQKRVEVIFDELLPAYLPSGLKGKKVLDAGCGTGWFSQRSAAVGAKVTSMDVGKKLLKEVAKKCSSELVVGSILDMPFKKNTFDVVTCSEVIEHVTDPQKAISEMYRVLKPGGIIFLTTPNAFWHFSLRIAEAFKVRPYQGLENWQSQTTLRRMFENVGFEVKEISGIHAFPFVVPALNPLLDVLHRWRKPLGPMMVNIAIAAVKPKP